MNQRFLHLHKWNNDFYIDDFIKNNLGELSSSELDNKIYNNNFYYGTALSTSFKRIGYQTLDIIADNYHEIISGLMKIMESQKQVMMKNYFKE